MAAEYDGANALQRRYVHGPGIDEPLVWYEGTGTTDRRWLSADQLGTVMTITNDSGAVTSFNTYDEYGAPALANVGRFQFTGQAWLPEVGLYYYRARMYNPYLGRFMQTDPILYEGGMNLYAYVGNDPVNRIDPWGLQDIVVPGIRDARDGWTIIERPENIYLETGGPSASPALEQYGDEAVEFNPDGSVSVRGCGVGCEQRRFYGYTNFVSDQLASWALQWGAEELAYAVVLGPLGPLRHLGRVCGCFEQGTMVATPDGLRPIETIEIGDAVLAWDPETGETTAQRVEALIRPEPRLIWQLEVRDADGETETFHVTDDHPWYVESVGWVETRHLAAGQRIETADDRGLLILDIARTDRVERTYNLTVSGPHTFLVGEDGAVVHNICRLASRVAGGIRVGPRVSEQRAASALRSGQDVYVATRQEAMALARRVDPAGAVRDPAHAAGYYSHAHGAGRQTGHVFYGAPRP